MADFTADFELGSNGATIATSDTGSATQWTTVDSTPIYDTAHAAHGTKAAKFTGTGQHLIWMQSSVADSYGRAYLYGDFTSAADNIIQISGAADPGQFTLIAFNGQFYLRDKDNTHQIGPGETLPVNTWFRIEWHITHSTTVGVMQLKTWNNKDSSGSPDDTLTSSANCNTGAAGGNITFQASNGLTVWMDDLVANATAYPGPAAVAAVATTATTTTGDVRGTYVPSSATDGTRRLVMAIALPAIAAGPNATRAGGYGVNQNLA